MRLSVPTTPKPFAGSSYTAAKALIDALAKYSAKAVKGLCIPSGSIPGPSEFMPEIRGQAWVSAHQRQRRSGLTGLPTLVILSWSTDLYAT
jgi:hypothetical protein